MFEIITCRTGLFLRMKRKDPVKRNTSKIKERLRQDWPRNDIIVKTRHPIQQDHQTRLDKK